MMKSIKRKNLLHIVTKLHILFHASHPRRDEDLKLAIRITKVLHRWVTREGRQGLDRYKVMSNFFIRHLMGTPLEQIPLSNRYKRLVYKAIDRCDSNLTRIYWVSVFSAARLYKLKPVVDVSTISSRFKGSLIKLFDLSLIRSLKTAKQSFSPQEKIMRKNWTCQWKWHISGASGPNGPLAFTQYLNDLRCVGNSRLGLYCLILFLALPFSNRKETVKALRDALLDSVPKGRNNAIHSKLVFIGDKAGKTRVVAIGDILSQSLLKVVHRRCNLYLRHLSQDGTFDQDQARRKIKKWSGEELPLASIDLTAVTDRMPVLYQALVIVYLRILTPLQALGWYLVTTKRDFVYFDGRAPKSVRYAVGQPMGLLSSWPVMAISHHFLVRWSYAACGWKRPYKARYCVLGDDLCMHNVSGVAEKYLHITSCLGMDYSVEKTYITKGAAEFAKSLYRAGEDLTPFPLALLVFRPNTVVSSVLDILHHCYRIKLSITAQQLCRVFPRRWRKLVLLSALSPQAQTSVLDLQSRKDFWAFLQFCYINQIRYFSRLNTVRDSTHMFVITDPGTSGNRMASPYLQIGHDNGVSYPVRRLKSTTENVDPVPLLGSNWISYCSVCWPNGLPPLGDERLVPGPIWQEDQHRDKRMKSLLLDFNKLLPNYFTVRCVGKQVAEIEVEPACYRSI